MAILPGATIGILGGGQLGRMTAMAARPLGYKVNVLDPDPSCAARFVVERCLTAPFDDAAAAEDLAKGCDVVTLEIEKISQDSLAAAARHAPVRPSAEVLATIQDRGRQREWLDRAGFPVGPYQLARSADELVRAAAGFNHDCFVKSCTGGYDGRGQVRLEPPTGAAPRDDGEAAARAAWTELGGAPVIVERALPLHSELSVLVARRPGGEMAVYPPALNHHEQRILAWSVLPGPLPLEITRQADEIARGVAEALRVEGLLVIEMFLLEGGRLLVNELAPRPHNSFHATEVACLTSQFEQHVRAVCDLPLGSTEVVRPAAIVNLLGELWLGPHPPAFAEALALPGVRLHLYGKRGARPGRKMGHLSAAGSSAQEAVALVQEAARRLRSAR